MEWLQTEWFNIVVHIRIVSWHKMNEYMGDKICKSKINPCKVSNHSIYLYQKVCVTSKNKNIFKQMQIVQYKSMWRIEAWLIGQVHFIFFLVLHTQNLTHAHNFLGWPLSLLLSLSLLFFPFSPFFTRFSHPVAVNFSFSFTLCSALLLLAIQYTDIYFVCSICVLHCMIYWYWANISVCVRDWAREQKKERERDPVKCHTHF